MFNSIAEMVAVAEAKGQRLAEVVMQAEVEQSQADLSELRQRMQRRLEVMRSSAEQGLAQPVISLSGISGGNA